MRSLFALCRMAVVGVSLVACQPPVPVTSGSSDFADLCAPCHGTSGGGDGRAAAGLEIKPADLTGLSARNGGTFPGAGHEQDLGLFQGRDGASMMPQFGPLLESPTVLVDVGDGIQTPTPERLIDLGNYLATIQK